MSPYISHNFTNKFIFILLQGDWVISLSSEYMLVYQPKGINEFFITIIATCVETVQVLLGKPTTSNVTLSFINEQIHLQGSQTVI